MLALFLRQMCGHLRRAHKGNHRQSKEKRPYVLHRAVFPHKDVSQLIPGSTGKRLYEERLPGAGRMAASLLIAGDYLYALDEDGRTFVVKTGPAFECVSVNKIDDLFWSTPSVAGDRLLLRGADRLYCIKE